MHVSVILSSVAAGARADIDSFQRYCCFTLEISSVQSAHCRLLKEPQPGMSFLATDRGLCVSLPHASNVLFLALSVTFCGRLIGLGRALYFAAVVSTFLLLLFSSPILSGRRLDVYQTSTQDVALVRI